MFGPHGAAQAQSEGEGQQLQKYYGDGDGENGYPVLSNAFNHFVHTTLQHRRLLKLLTEGTSNFFQLACDTHSMGAVTQTDRKLICGMNININQNSFFIVSASADENWQTKDTPKTI